MKNLKSIKMEKLSNLKWFFQNKKTGTESERKRSLRAAVIFSMDKLKTKADAPNRTLLSYTHHRERKRMPRDFKWCNKTIFTPP